MKAECHICFEEQEGFSCRSDSTPPGHHICRGCFQKYMDNNVFPEFYKLRDHLFRVSCPAERCDEHYDVLQIWCNLSKQQKVRCIDIAKNCVNGPDDSIHSAETDGSDEVTSTRIHRRRLLELLTIKCKTCGATVDPSPDACSAVKCLGCGQHYCAYCLKSGFDLDDSENDSSLAHVHTATHHPSEIPTERNAFLPAEIVKEGQKIFLKGLLVQYLVSTPKARYDVDTQHTKQFALLLCSSELSELGICLEEIYEQLQDNAHAEKAHAERNQLPLPPPAPSGQKSGRLFENTAAVLENALITRNPVACQQILSMANAPPDFDYISRDGLPLLSLALAVQDTQTALKLLDLGFDPIKIMPKQTRNALYIAIEQDLVEVVLSIIGKHPEVLNVPCNDEIGLYTPLLVACRWGSSKSCEALLQLADQLDLEWREAECNFTPLALAAACNNEEVACQLIRAGVQLSVKVDHRKDRTPMYILAEHGLSEAILLALNTREDWDPNHFVNNLEDSLLHVAASRNHIYLLSELLDHPRILPERIPENASGFDPFLAAVCAGHDRAAVYLSSKIQSYVEHKPISALVMALDKDCPGAVMILFKDADIKPEFLLNRAMARGSNRCCDALVEDEGLLSCNIVCASVFGRADLLTRLLAKTNEVLLNTLDNESFEVMEGSYRSVPIRTQLLLKAIDINRIDLFRQLLRVCKKSHMFLTTSDGLSLSVLHFAVARNATSIAVLLSTKFPALIENRDSNDRTPMHYAPANSGMERALQGAGHVRS